MKAIWPAPERNKGPLLEVLKQRVGDGQVVLEIASGTGQHVAHFAASLPKVTFRPSDPSAEWRASIAAHVAEAGLANVEPPLEIDVCVPGWEQAVDAVLCANMIHIAPWAAAEGLFAGARACLQVSGGPLVLYGPYRFQGAFTSPSNEEFDASLRAKDPSWGVRDVDDLDALARGHGLRRVETIPMPANNHALVFRR
ncbi:MAG: DUF938 domain-containing protein [Polyangiaceae bacterium]|nr:DUF938 domain-containing protein [Polyangiaceae bacterium]